MYAHFKTEYDAFNVIVTDYNLKKDAYNNAVVSEKERLSDFINTYFTEAIAVPQRPCAPTQPMLFNGPSMKLKQSTTATPVTWDTVKAQTDKTAYMAYSTTNMPSD